SRRHRPRSASGVSRGPAVDGHTFICVAQLAKIVHNADGNYRFIAVEGGPFSGGAVADPGYDMVHARLAHPVPLEEGLSAAAREAARDGRPVLALAGFVLRILGPLTRTGFSDYHDG